LKSNRDANRQLFPQCAAFIGDMRKSFGSVTVHYVREGGREKGKPMNGDEDAK
jgi:hypothetical protein